MSKFHFLFDTNINNKKRISPNYIKSKKLCKIKNCTNRRQVNGICVKHGAKLPKCFIKKCTNYIVRNRICIKHGARNKLHINYIISHY